MSSNVQKALSIISNEFATMVRAELAAIQLEGSEVQKSVDVQPEGNSAVVLTANFYAEFIISGRKPGTKKVPIDALITWINRKGIQATGPGGAALPVVRLAFAIQNSIHKKGIKPRDFLTPAVDAITPIANEMLLDAIYKDLLESMSSEFKLLQ